MSKCVTFRSIFCFKCQNRWHFVLLVFSDVKIGDSYFYQVIFSKTSLNIIVVVSGVNIGDISIYISFQMSKWVTIRFFVCFSDVKMGDNSIFGFVFRCLNSGNLVLFLFKMSFFNYFFSDVKIGDLWCYFCLKCYFLINFFSDVKIGDVLFCETPYSSVLLPEHYASHCHHCYKVLLVAVPCLKCTQPRYCSESCRIKSW